MVAEAEVGETLVEDMVEELGEENRGEDTEEGEGESLAGVMG